MLEHEQRLVALAGIFVRLAEKIKGNW